MTRLEPGLEFAPGLTLVRRLGRGGMGEVWIARDASRDEEVVAKVLSVDAPPERVALLRREARLVRKVQHPGIVPVYRFEQGPHGSAVVMRYMRGGDASRLRGATPLEILRVGRSVAEALGHLHGLGVVHRDVKATNVLLDDGGRAHLADFGIAAVADPHDDEGLVLHGGGSRASMSPQQRAGETAQPADDIYALGVLLHELLSGRPLFPVGATDDEMSRATSPPVEAAHPVPERLSTLVASMLARSPAERPRDMNAVGRALRAVEEQLAPPSPTLSPPSAPSAPPGGRLQPPPRVPEVGVVAAPPVSVPPPPMSSRRPLPPASVRPASSPNTRILLFGALGLAVLFVVLVLPRWAQSPGPAGSSESKPDVAASAESPDPTAEPIAVPRAPAEAPPEPAPPAEATPPPAPRAQPAPATPRSRPVAAGSREPSEPAAEPTRRRTDEEFAAAMSEAQAALEREDWPAARSALARASTLRPGSSPVTDARRRVEDGQRTAALAQQREKARAFEANEDWPHALAEYEAALKLDPVVAFALEGRDRTKARATLAERLDFHVANPLRLATDAVAREAGRLLQQAREVDSPGPRHRRQVESLEKALAEVRTPVAVILESDGETEIVVHKVGRLGTFTRKTLELHPGTYTVVGTRRGYRDVRRQLVIGPAAAPPPLLVRCEEEI